MYGARRFAGHFSRQLRERPRHHQWEHHRRLAVHLDWFRVQPDFAPRDGFVGPRAAVRPVVLLPRVDEDGKLGAVAHKVRVADVVFHNTAADDEHPGALRVEREVVDVSYVARGV